MLLKLFVVVIVIIAVFYRGQDTSMTSYDIQIDLFCHNPSLKTDHGLYPYNLSIYKIVLYIKIVHKPSIFTLEVIMENGTVHKPSIFTSGVIMEAESPPNH